MAVEKIRDTGQTLTPPTGKLLGIVDTRADLDRVTGALKSAGFKRIEALGGDDGINLLERIDTFFFSDMEERVIARHVEELKSGHFVIAFDTPADQVDEAVRIATQNGARRLVRFGLLTVTWLTK